MLKPISVGVYLGTLITALGFGQVPAPPERPSAPPPAFEVATIKPTDPAFPGTIVGGFRVGRFSSAQGFLPLKDLIAYANDVDNRQIVGGQNSRIRKGTDILGKPEKSERSEPEELATLLPSTSFQAFSTEDTPRYQGNACLRNDGRNKRLENEATDRRRCR